MPPVDPNWVKRSLVEGMCSDVSRRGKIPDVRFAEDYIVDILQGMDAKKSTPRPAPTKVVEKPEDRAEVYAREFKKKTGRELHGLTLEREMNRKGRIITEKEMSTGLMGSIVSRLRVIRHNPELYQRVKVLVLVLSNKSRAKRLQAAHVLFKLMDETDKIVGYSWRKPKPEKLVFSG